MLFDTPPKNWRISTLGEICQEGGGDIQTGPFGSQLHASDYVISGIPSIMPANIKDGRVSEDGIARITEADAKRLSKYLTKAGDIVYSRRGDVERCALIRKREEGWLCGTGCLRVRPGSGVVDPDFCSHFLSHPETKEWISRHAVGATMPNLNTQILSALPVLLPSLQEQKAIAHILGTLDDKIELNRKTNETLEAMAKALFKSWFVDFDPVRAKAEGRPTGLPAEIIDLFPDSFEDSELGEIPSGWETGRLEEILEIDPPRQLSRGSISPYLEMKGVPTSGHSAVDVIGREFSSGSKFRNGDTLLARITPCLENGKTAFVDFLKDGETGWGSTEFIVMCGRREEVNPFAYYLARSEVFRNNAIQHMVGSSGRQRVPSDAVSGFTLPLPPEEVLVKFGLLASGFMHRISANADQSSILSKIRDALLPRLISGEIRIPDAEMMLEEVGV